MVRSIPTIFFFFCVGCSSAGPPHGPKYVPSDSAETTTQCPDARTKAQEAREALLGTTARDLQIAAGKAVLLHAECEEATANSVKVTGTTADNILDELRSLRLQTQNALNLYRELRQYKEPLLLLKSLVAQGRLQTRFANIVSSVVSPADLEVQARMEFQGELAAAAIVLRQEAGAVLEEAVVLAGGVGEAAAVRLEACELLASIGRPAVCE